MNKDNVVELSVRENHSDTVTELMKTGAQQLLQQAVEGELNTFMEQFENRCLDNGCAAVVRSGYFPELDLQTGIGPVNIKVPKVRSRDGEPETFRPALVPPYVRNTKSLEAALPWLHLNTASRQTLQGLFISRYNAAHDVQTRAVRP